MSEVESGMVVRSLARTLTPMSNLVLSDSFPSVTVSRDSDEWHSPSSTKVPTVRNIVRRLLIVNHDKETTLISKLVLVSTLCNHPPTDPSILTEERVALVVREEVRTDRSNGHDESRSGRGEDATIVVRLSDGMDVEGASREVGRIARDLLAV